MGIVSIKACNASQITVDVDCPNAMHNFVYHLNIAVAEITLLKAGLLLLMGNFISAYKIMDVQTKHYGTQSRMK